MSPSHRLGLVARSVRLSSRSALSSLAIFGFIACAACGGGPEPSAANAAAGAPTTPTTNGATPPSTEPRASSSAAAPAAEATEPARRRKPFDILNSCGEVVTVLFGEDPKAANAGRRTIASNATSDGPRDDAGNQTVWLLDDKGEALVKVHVTRGMKRVEIGKSCRSLDAR